eukprot:422539-Karenia_brevis.AAC.1
MDGTPSREQWKSQDPHSASDLERMEAVDARYEPVALALADLLCNGGVDGKEGQGCNVDLPAAPVHLLLPPWRDLVHEGKGFGETPAQPGSSW